MTIALEEAVAVESVDESPVKRRRSRWPAILLFVGLTAGYFTVGAVMIMRFNFFESDGLSRVANAGYTLMSRDPHLAAIGFVWNPLPSLAQIPLLPLSYWWPELKTYGLAGMLQSAAFMAGATLIVRQIAFDRGVGPLWRWVAVFCFALNPMIILYGASAMSEASMLMCMLWCTRYVMRWLYTQRTGDLAWAGIALGVGYLTRYEMIPAACGVAALVAVVEFRRSPEGARLSAAALSVLIVGFPIIVAFVVWAVTGWVVNGELFATVSSQYGNTAQVKTAVARGGIVENTHWLVIAERMFGMQPFAGIAAILAGTISVLLKRAHALVPVAIFGSVLAFAAWGHYTAATFGWFRFYLPGIPLVVVVALACWTRAAGLAGVRRRGSWTTTRTGAALLCASVAIGMPVTGFAMFNPDNSGNQPLLLGLNSLLDPIKYPPEVYRRMTGPDHQLADYLDRKKLPNGAVLMDTFIGSLVWLASDDPRQFMVTSDYDFTAALNRPWDFGVQYILVSNPAGNAAKDAITERYPSMWANGAGIGKLVHSAGPTGTEWRLYQVIKPEVDNKPVSANRRPAPKAGG